MKKLLVCAVLFSAIFIIQSCSSTTATDIQIPVNPQAPVAVTPEPVKSAAPAAPELKVSAPAPSVPAELTPVKPAPVAAAPSPQPFAPVENIENVVPNAVNVNNQALVEALNDDPMLKTSPITEAPNTGTLSGQAESNIINSGDASFENINQQVDNDISTANTSIESNQNDSSESSEISQEMGLNDVSNLSVPQENISTGKVSN